MPPPPAPPPPAARQRRVAAHLPATCLLVLMLGPRSRCGSGLHVLVQQVLGWSSLQVRGGGGQAGLQATAGRSLLPPRQEQQPPRQHVRLLPAVATAAQAGATATQTGLQATASSRYSRPGRRYSHSGSTSGSRWQSLLLPHPIHSPVEPQYLHAHLVV